MHDFAVTNPQYPLVSVLFITYKRYDLLERSLRLFLGNTDYPNLEIVIADDGSGPKIQNKIRQLPAHVFALAPKNRGLGANNNNGLRHCTGKYILMIQDDCACQGPRDYLRNTIRVMEENPEVGIINYCGITHPLDTAHPLPGSDEPCYRILRPYDDGTIEHHLYTDQPHVRSRSALAVLGEYSEPRGIGNCEEEYSRRWRDQDRFSTAVFPAYHRKTFVHEGAEQSFRARLFVNRLDAFLMPIAKFLEQHCTILFVIGKASVRKFTAMLRKLGIVQQ